jgi:hypothetical protein
MPIQPIFCSFFAIPVSSLSQLAACHYDTRPAASTAVNGMARMRQQMTGRPIVRNAPKPDGGPGRQRTNRDRLPAFASTRN